MIQHFRETTKLFTKKSSAKTNHLSAQILRHFMGFYSLICPLVNFFLRVSNGVGNMSRSDAANLMRCRFVLLHFVSIRAF